jgi:hypothetical protein
LIDAIAVIEVDDTGQHRAGPARPTEAGRVVNLAAEAIEESRGESRNSGAFVRLAGAQARGLGWLLAPV